MRQRLGGVFQVAEASPFCLFRPFGRIVVAVEDDALVLADGAHHERVQRRRKVGGGFQLVGELPQGIRHDGVDDDVRPRQREGRADHAELELVARKGEGRGAVAVRRVLGDDGQRIDAQLHHLAVGARVRLFLFERGEDGFQLFAYKHGDDGGRRFVGAQAVVVARAGHGKAQKILMVVDRLDDRHQKQHELAVFGGRFAGVEQVEPRIRAHRPVVVLARTVDALKGLFVQQAHQAVAARHFLHDLHHQLVLVGGYVDGGEDGRQFVLGGRHLVVLGLGEDAVPPQLFVQFLHKGGNARLDGAEIVVLQLLPFGRLGAEQRPARKDEVLSLFVHGAVDEEVFLLRPDLRDDALRRGIAEQAQDAHRFFIERFHALQKRSLFIQHFAAVREEGRGDVQGAVLDEGEGRGVPRRVAARFKGGAHPARGEGRGVRLAHHQLFARKFHDDFAVFGGGNEAVVLFGGDARHGLEPVGEVGGALLHRPVLHGVGDHVGNAHVQRMAEADGLDQRLIRFFGQPLLHDLTVEYVGCENLRNTHVLYLQKGKNKKRRRRLRILVEACRAPKAPRVSAVVCESRATPLLPAFV